MAGRRPWGLLSGPDPFEPFTAARLVSTESLARMEAVVNLYHELMKHAVSDVWLAEYLHLAL